jgi:IS5 family transposase
MFSKQLGYHFEQGFAYGDDEQTTVKKRTKLERFQSKMVKVVRWKALLVLIEPPYPKTSSRGGRPSFPLQNILRIDLLQQWYSLSDPALEDALIEVPTMHHFAGDQHDQRSNP